MDSNGPSPTAAKSHILRAGWVTVTMLGTENLGWSITPGEKPQLPSPCDGGPRLTLWTGPADPRGTPDPAPAPSPRSCHGPCPGSSAHLLPIPGHAVLPQGCHGLQSGPGAPGRCATPPQTPVGRGRRGPRRRRGGAGGGARGCLVPGPRPELSAPSPGSPAPSARQEGKSTRQLTCAPPSPDAAKEARSACALLREPAHTLWTVSCARRHGNAGSPRHGARGCVPSYCRTLGTPTSQPGASPLLGLTVTTALRGKHVSE